MVMSCVGLVPGNDCAVETSSSCKRQTHPRQRGCYTRTMTASVQFKKKIAVRESQGACRQNKLISGKLSVVK
jgi:hypothetical protein